MILCSLLLGLVALAVDDPEAGLSVDGPVDLYTSTSSGVVDARLEPFDIVRVEETDGAFSRVVSVASPDVRGWAVSDELLITGRDRVAGTDERLHEVVVVEGGIVPSGGDDALPFGARAVVFESSAAGALLIGAPSEQRLDGRTIGFSRSERARKSYWPIGWVDRDAVLDFENGAVAAERRRGYFETRVLAPSAQSVDATEVLERPAFADSTGTTPHGAAQALAPYYVIRANNESGRLLLATRPRLELDALDGALVGWVDAVAFERWDRRGLEVRARDPQWPIEVFSDDRFTLPIARWDAPQGSAVATSRLLALDVAPPYLQVAFLAERRGDDLAPGTRLPELPTSGPTDVAFLIDSSKSMAPHRPYITELVQEIARGLFDGEPVGNVRAIVGFYTDFVRLEDGFTLGEPLLGHPLTMGQGAVRELNGLKALLSQAPPPVGTIDRFEAIHAAIGGAAASSHWPEADSDSAARVIVVIGDAGDRLASDANSALSGDADDRRAVERIRADSGRGYMEPFLPDRASLDDFLASNAVGGVVHVCGVHARDKRIVRPTDEELARHREEVGSPWVPAPEHQRFEQQLRDLADATGGMFWFAREYIPWLDDEKDPLTDDAKDDGENVFTADARQAARPIVDYLRRVAATDRSTGPFAARFVADRRDRLTAALAASVGGPPAEAIGALAAAAPRGTDSVAFADRGLIDGTEVEYRELLLLEQSEIGHLRSDLAQLIGALEYADGDRVQHELDRLMARLSGDPGKDGFSPRQVLRAMGLDGSDPDLYEPGTAFPTCAGRDRILERLAALDDRLAELEAEGLVRRNNSAVWSTVPGRTHSRNRISWLPVDALP